jgi:hypothetical protein
MVVPGLARNRRLWLYWEMVVSELNAIRDSLKQVRPSLTSGDHGNVVDDEADAGATVLVGSRHRHC